MDNNEEIKKKKRKKIIIIMLIALFVVTIGIIICFSALIYNNKKTNTTKKLITEDFRGDIDKPIIYLYPEKTTELTVSLGKPENISCSYPQYNEDGWQIIANPDGSLIDKQTGRNLYSLYWEGKNDNASEFDEGFVVKGEDTINFLEDKLAILGLNERESEEFIVYWLPKLQNNKYNLIKFLNKDEIEESMPLNFSVQPDSVIRVLMQFKKLDAPIDIKEQNLTTPKRNGFTVVEWGGSEKEV